MEEFADYLLDHTDLPRLRKGRVGAQFWSAYVSCGSQYKDAVQLFMEQIDVIKRLVNEYPNDLQFATSTQGDRYKLSILKEQIIVLN